MSTQLYANYTNDKPEIVINATKITANNASAEIYEFVLDIQLKLVACSYIESVSQGKAKLIKDFPQQLDGMLFELNHVRVNPRLNNELILHRFKKLLLDSGVQLIAPPEEILMAMCYRPIGELSDLVRFYLRDKDSLIFLSRSVKLSVI